MTKRTFVKPHGGSKTDPCWMCGVHTRELDERGRCVDRSRCDASVASKLKRVLVLGQADGKPR